MIGIMGGLLPALGLQAAAVLYKTYQRVKMSVSKD